MYSIAIQYSYSPLKLLQNNGYIPCCCTIFLCCLSILYISSLYLLIPHPCLLLFPSLSSLVTTWTHKYKYRKWTSGYEQFLSASTMKSPFYFSPMKANIFFKKFNTSFYLFVWPLWVFIVSCRIYFSDQGLNSGPLRQEHRVLATGPPGKFLKKCL